MHQGWVKISLITWMLVCGILPTKAQKYPHKSPFNQKIPTSPQNGEAYNFWVGGHLYGKDKDHNQYWPSRNFIANIPKLNASDGHFFLGLGDLFPDGKEEVVRANFLEVIHQLKMPFYNSPGNHDLRYNLYYRQTFGPGQWHFQYGPDLFISLDSERMVSHQYDPVQNISGQLKFVEKVLSRMEQTKPRHTFVFMHKLLWAKIYPEQAFMLEYTNDNYRKLSDSDSLKMIAQVIEKISSEGTVTWISGDIGVKDSKPLYFHQSEDQTRTFLGCGINDSPDDVLLNIRVATSGEITYHAASLTGDTVNQLEFAGPTQWQQIPPRPKPVEKTTESEVKNMLDHHYFWNGIMLGIAILSLIWLLISRIKRKSQRNRS